MRISTKSKMIATGKERRPNYAICVPTFGTVSVYWAAAMMRLANPINARVEQYMVQCKPTEPEYNKDKPSMYIVQSMEIGEARNYLCERAIESKCEYIYFADDDVLPPWDCILNLWEAIKRYDPDAIGGAYHTKQTGHESTMIGWCNHHSEGMRENIDYRPGEVVPVDLIGMGATFIKTATLKKMPKPWFKTGPSLKDGVHIAYTEDAHYCNRLRSLGGKIMLHTGVKCGHIDTKSGIIY